ncbi:MAG: cytochrome c [Chloroflexota bacterium]
MTLRVYGALLITMLLLAACGRQLPEEGVPGASAPVAAQPTAAPTDEPAEEEVAAEETEAVEAAATEDMDAEAEATEDMEAEAEATEDMDADAEDDTETADAEDDPIAMAIAAGDPAVGAQLFQQQYQTSVGPWICASCHSVDASGLRLVGPTMWGLTETGEARIAETGDESVPAYIYNSIVNPGAYIVPADEGGPYPENLMPPNYSELLTEEELNHLVAYILTLNE